MNAKPESPSSETLEAIAKASAPHRRPQVLLTLAKWLETRRLARQAPQPKPS